MKDYQVTVLKMIHEIIKFFNDNPDLLKNNPALKDHYDLLVALAKEIEENALVQNTDFKGITLDKNKAKALLAIMTYQLGGGLRSLATDTENNDLFEESKRTVKQMQKDPDEVLVIYVALVLKNLNKYIDALAPYNITADKIKGLEDLLKDFRIQLLLPAKMRKEVKTATANIKKLISKALILLANNIDNDMLQYETTLPKIYDAYDVLREIDDSQTRHLALFGHALGEETKLGLADVAVTIIRSKAAGGDITKYTTETGYYRFKKLEPGKYIIRFELENYDTLQLEVTIVKSKSTKLDVELRKTE